MELHAEISSNICRYAIDLFLPDSTPIGQIVQAWSRVFQTWASCGEIGETEKRTWATTPQANALLRTRSNNQLFAGLLRRDPTLVHRKPAKARVS